MANHPISEKYMKLTRNTIVELIRSLNEDINAVENRKAKQDILIDESLLTALNELRKSIFSVNTIGLSEEEYTLNESDIPPPISIEDQVQSCVELAVRGPGGNNVMLYVFLDDADAHVAFDQVTKHNIQMKEANLPIIDCSMSRVSSENMYPKDRIIVVPPGRLSNWFDVSMLQEFIHKTVRCPRAPGLDAFIRAHKKEDSSKKDSRSDMDKFNEEFENFLDGDRKESRRSDNVYESWRRRVNPLDPNRIPDWGRPPDIICSSHHQMSSPFIFSYPSIVIKKS